MGREVIALKQLSMSSWSCVKCKAIFVVLSPPSCVDLCCWCRPSKTWTYKNGKYIVYRKPQRRTVGKTVGSKKVQKRKT